VVFEQRLPRVHAFRIKSVVSHDEMNGVTLLLEDDRKVTVPQSVLSRCPVSANQNDYYVVNEQGVVSLAARAVFEKSWKAVSPEV